MRSGPAGCSVNWSPAQVIVPPRRSPRGTNSPTTVPAGSIAWISRCQKPCRLICQLRAPRPRRLRRARRSLRAAACPRRQGCTAGDRQVPARARARSCCDYRAQTLRRQRENTSSRSARFVRDEDEEPVAGLMTVLPRGGIVVAARHDGDERVARQAELADCRAGDRVVGANREVDEVERAAMVDRDRRLARRRPAGRAAERGATRSSVVPCTSAETTTTKKTALKIVSRAETCDESTKVPRTIGTAPRRPAQPSSARSRLVKSLNAVEAQTAAGRTTKVSAAATRSPAAPRPAGRWEDEQPEHDEHRHLGHERQPLVERDQLPAIARRRAPDGEADQVDGQEPAAAEHVRGSERDRGRGDRRDRGERPDGRWDAREQPRRGDGERDTDREPEPDLAARPSSTRSATP